VTENGVEPLAYRRVLLIGDPSARPTGLEQALTRAGFHLVESEDASAALAADAVLITMKDIEPARLAELLSCPAGPGPAAPRVVLTASSDRDGPAEALEVGAADALASPVHLPELCARLHTRIRERQGPEPAVAPATSWPDGALDALDRRVRQEFERARRYSLSFSLILLRVEELHSVEERSGPEAADRLRNDVVSALRKELRLPDFVVTYGASEFAIVLPETGQTGARQSVIRVRDRLSVVPSEGDPRLDRPRFSAGIVTYPHPAVSQTDELLALAEAALMRGKAQAGERIGMAI
jgi:diguanylate cyclase (GGDEF)-like protein